MAPQIVVIEESHSSDSLNTCVVMVVYIRFGALAAKNQSASTATGVQADAPAGVGTVAAKEEWVCRYQDRRSLIV